MKLGVKHVTYAGMDLCMGQYGSQGLERGTFDSEIQKRNGVKLLKLYIYSKQVNSF